MSCKLLYILTALLAASATVWAQPLLGVAGLVQRLNNGITNLLDEVKNVTEDLLNDINIVEEEVKDLVDDLEQQLEAMQSAMDTAGRGGVYSLATQVPELSAQLGTVTARIDALATVLRNRTANQQGEQKARTEAMLGRMQQINQRAQQMQQNISAALKVAGERAVQQGQELAAQAQQVLDSGKLQGIARAALKTAQELEELGQLQVQGAEQGIVHPKLLQLELAAVAARNMLNMLQMAQGATSFALSSVQEVIRRFFPSFSS